MKKLLIYSILVMTSATAWSTDRDFFPRADKPIFKEGTIAPAGIHNILSAVHGDSAPSAAARGALLVRNSSSKWARLAMGVSGTVVLSNGTDTVFGTVDITDGTNLAVTAPITLTADTIGITVAKDIVAGVGLSGGENNVLPGSDADTTLTFDATELAALTWDAGSEASIAWSWNLVAGDPTITFGNDLITISNSLTVVTGKNITLGTTQWNSSDEIDGTQIKDADYGDVDVSAPGAWTVSSVQNDSVTLTTDTTGNYVASITDGLAIDGGDGGSEGAALTIAFDPTELLGNRTWGDASTDTIVWTWDRATGTDPTFTFGDNLISTANVFVVEGLGTGGRTSYDLKVGDTTTPDYGMIQFGNAVLGRTSYKVGNIDLDGAILFQNIGGPVTSDVEFCFAISTGSSTRFALAKAGVGLASYHSRSFLIAGPAPADTDYVKVSYWQTTNSIFDNLACDTAGTGADLGVQNDLEVEGDIFVDSIKESTTGAGITFNDFNIVSVGNITGTDVDISAGTGDYTATGDVTLSGLDSIVDLSGVTVTNAFQNIFKANNRCIDTAFAANICSGFIASSSTDDNWLALAGKLATSNIFRVGVDADVNSRFTILANGQMRWGDGTGTGDTILFRAGANHLKTDDKFECTELQVDDININGSTISEGGDSDPLVITSTDILIDSSSAGSIDLKTAANITLGDGGTTNYLEISAAGLPTLRNGQELRFNDTGDSNYVGFKAPALTGNQIWTLPDTDGVDGDVMFTDGSGNLKWGANASTRAFTFSSPSGGSGTIYAGGHYRFGATDNDFNPGINFGTANGAYGDHIFLVAAAGASGGTDTVVRINGTTIDDSATRTAGVNVDLTLDDAGAAGAYYETSEKWVGQVSITKLSGPDLLCNYGGAKYWDDNNEAFKVEGVDVTWLGGANDGGANLILRHHKATGWTYNAGSTPTPPTAIASMNTDYVTEINILNGEEGAWKRTDLTENVDGSASEGIIIEIITTANKAFEIGNFLIRVVPQ